jgi:divalent metal cation (Fe/Co/Zn/Cd) transporter
LDAWKLRLASVVGLLLGFAGFLVWYSWITEICGSFEPLATGPCSLPPSPIEAWTALFALVALVILSSIVLVHTFRGKKG